MLRQARVRSREQSKQANRSEKEQAKSKTPINRPSPGEKKKKAEKTQTRGNGWKEGTEINATNWQTMTNQGTEKRREKNMTGSVKHKNDTRGENYKINPEMNQLNPKP